MRSLALSCLHPTSMEMSAPTDRRRTAYAALAALALLAASCNSSHKPAGEPVQIKPPLGLPAVPIPPSNPPTSAPIALGQKLFFDVNLSPDRSLSCASCHNPDLGFSDGHAAAKRVGGLAGSANSP